MTKEAEVTEQVTTRNPVDELLHQIETLSADYGPKVEEAIRLAQAAPLDAARAERLWTAVLGVMRTAGRDLDDQQRAEVARDIEAEVRHIVNSTDRPTDDPPSGGLELVKKRGLEPHDVRPVPVFNGLPIPMREGYVDVTTLRLWKDNQRVKLHVQEFMEQNHREPEEAELIMLMHGDLPLPSLNTRKKASKDPFEIVPLAGSIARKGVEQPPIVTFEGEPKDGNRRIAASLYVLNHPELYDAAAMERARWIRVWQAPFATTDDLFDAIVVALNFEEPHKEPWPEYVKARLVADYYDTIRAAHSGRFTPAKDRELRKEVAGHFAIEHGDVLRYVRMVRWAEDFERYHVDEQAKNPALVRYKANDIFQWFYEIQAGKGNEKLTEKLDTDDELKQVVYDLMYDVLDSGAQVRNLHKVVGDDDAVKLLLEAHESASAKDEKEALRLVNDAIHEAQRKTIAKRKIGYDQWLKTAVDKLGSTTPDQWRTFDTELLLDLQRVFRGTLGAIEGELATRGEAHSA